MSCDVSPVAMFYVVGIGGDGDVNIGVLVVDNDYSNVTFNCHLPSSVTSWASRTYSELVWQKDGTGTGSRFTQEMSDAG